MTMVTGHYTHISTHKKNPTYPNNSLQGSQQQDSKLICCCDLAASSSSDSSSSWPQIGHAVQYFRQTRSELVCKMSISPPPRYIYASVAAGWLSRVSVVSRVSRRMFIAGERPSIRWDCNTIPWSTICQVCSRSFVLLLLLNNWVIRIHISNYFLTMSSSAYVRSQQKGVFQHHIVWNIYPPTSRPQHQHIIITWLGVAAPETRWDLWQKFIHPAAAAKGRPLSPSSQGDRFSLNNKPTEAAAPPPPQCIYVKGLVGLWNWIGIGVITPLYHNSQQSTVSALNFLVLHFIPFSQIHTHELAGSLAVCPW